MFPKHPMSGEICKGLKHFVQRDVKY